MKKEPGIKKNNQLICFLKQKKLIEHEALYEERREFPIIFPSSNPSAVQLFKYLFPSVWKKPLHPFSFLYPHHRKLISWFSYIFLKTKKKKEKKNHEVRFVNPVQFGLVQREKPNKFTAQGFTATKHKCTPRSKLDSFIYLFCTVTCLNQSNTTSCQ